MHKRFLKKSTFAAFFLAATFYVPYTFAFTFNIQFGDHSGPSTGVLASTSLADILTGNAEGLFSSQNLQFASFSSSGLGQFNFGNVTSVGAITQISGNDYYRIVTGNLFSGGAKIGSYNIQWIFNTTLDPTTQFPPGSGSPALLDVVAHPAPGAFPGDFPNFIADYTARSLFSDKYGAILTIADLVGNTVFSSQARNVHCANPASCSGFEVVHNVDFQFSNPVDRLSLFFSGPESVSIPEPVTFALISLGLSAMAFGKRRKLT